MQSKGRYLLHLSEFGEEVSFETYSDFSIEEILEKHTKIFNKEVVLRELNTFLVTFGVLYYLTIIDTKTRKRRLFAIVEKEHEELFESSVVGNKDGSKVVKLIKEYKEQWV